ncbi:hypothetical protein BDN72DRAFT_126567 [Pluteus cervinus]|uniref:Uncharacterized protein n=1 Tax=Pluteus cervinus TaxID=181527 RepID=A0ACD3AM82_9AGAR|nr:hypothetical protein BDN72DRAFT_126567 [Pluteus cervinus]
MTTAADLPIELVQGILLTSVGTSLNQAAIVGRISRHIYNLIKPILFRTFVYWDEEHSWPGKLDLKWLTTNGGFARNLLLCDEELGQNLPIILGSCPNLRNIAIWLHSNYDFPTLLEPLSQLRPRQLSADLPRLFGGLFEERHAHLPMFANLTHLEVGGDRDDWNIIKGIQYIPRLTHLSIPIHRDLPVPPIIRDALEHCNNLAILVVFSSHRVNSLELMNTGEVVIEAPLPSMIQDITDPRIISLKCNYLKEWELGSQGGRGMWTLAEEVMERRTRNL